MGGFSEPCGKLPEVPDTSLPETDPLLYSRLNLTE
jgi:hypothetical protein